MKYYSERLNRLYDTEEELFRAEGKLSEIIKHPTNPITPQTNADFNPITKAQTPMAFKSDNTALKTALLLLLLNN